MRVYVSRGLGRNDSICRLNCGMAGKTECDVSEGILFIFQLSIMKSTGTVGRYSGCYSSIVWFNNFPISSILIEVFIGSIFNYSL